MIGAGLLLLAAIPSSPDLGKAAGRCRGAETGSSFVVTVTGLADRKGLLKLELYPANDQDFLADDNVLVGAGKPFARVEAAVPQSGIAELCIRAPTPGPYALSVLHDRNSDRRFNLSLDGIGFSNNPKLGWGKPSAAAVRTIAGAGPTRLQIILNYRKGLFSLGPLRE